MPSCSATNFIDVLLSSSMLDKIAPLLISGYVSKGCALLANQFITTPIFQLSFVSNNLLQADNLVNKTSYTMKSTQPFF